MINTSTIPIDIQDRPLKYDEGKPKLHLVPTILTHMMAKVYEWGINNKYRRDSWKEFPLDKAREDLTPAAMRHIDAYRDGEWLDPQTKLPHLILAIWNCTTLLWHESRDRKRAIDKPGEDHSEWRQAEDRIKQSYFDAPPTEDIKAKLADCSSNTPEPYMDGGRLEWINTP